MNQKSKKTLKALRVWLAENEKTMTQLAKEIGVGRSTIYMAVYADAKRGKVAEWMDSNLKSAKNLKKAS